MHKILNVCVWDAHAISSWTLEMEWIVTFCQSWMESLMSVVNNDFYVINLLIDWIDWRTMILVIIYIFMTDVDVMTDANVDADVMTDANVDAYVMLVWRKCTKQWIVSFSCHFWWWLWWAAQCWRAQQPLQGERFSLNSFSLLFTFYFFSFWKGGMVSH